MRRNGRMTNSPRTRFEDTFEDRGPMRMTPLWFAPYSGPVVAPPDPLEGKDDRRSRSRSDARGRGERAADRARARDARVRAPLVEVRRLEGAGDPRAVRRVRHAVLPAAQHAHRPAGGPGPRPDAREAAAPPAAVEAARPLRAPVRPSRLTPVRPGIHLRFVRPVGPVRRTPVRLTLRLIDTPCVLRGAGSRSVLPSRTSPRAGTVLHQRAPVGASEEAAA